MEGTRPGPWALRSAWSVVRAAMVSVRMMGLSVSSRASIALTSENIRPIYETRKSGLREIDTSPSRWARGGALERFEAR